MNTSRRFFVSLGIAASCGYFSLSHAQTKSGLPTAAQALDLTPIQEVDFARPGAAEIEKCRVEAETIGGKKAYSVFDAKGQILRRFVDSNGDNKVDTWCYFQDNTEVYRDLDTDGNGKADQYRWLGIAGTRWAIDSDEDTVIDRWKVISAEETAEEVVAALRTKDILRFERVLITLEETRELGLSADRTAELEKLSGAAKKAFVDLAKKQNTVTSDTVCTSFEGGKPGVIVGEKNDLCVYDNATAMIQTKDKHGQIALYSMVRIGDGWRVIDVPHNLGEEHPANLAGFFFQAPLARADEPGSPAPAGVSAEFQSLVADLEKLDKDLAAAAPEKAAKINAARADLLEKIASQASGEDRAVWWKQYAETVAAAVSSGGFPGGTERLKNAATALSKEKGQDDLVVFVGFRALQTDYNSSLQTAKEADIPKIHASWIEGLERLVQDYAASKEAAEPMLALAQEQEVAGKETDAAKWYGRIVKDFPTSEYAKKAAGAKRRLESAGQKFALTGSTLEGKTLNPAALQGKVVAVQYWATWCDVCKQDFVTLKTLQAKYGKNFQVIGINLDSNREDALRQLKATPVTWPNLYEPGGFDSRYANEMGIFTLPMMLLLDQQGRVVSRNITAGELDVELRKLVK